MLRYKYRLREKIPIVIWTTLLALSGSCLDFCTILAILIFNCAFLIVPALLYTWTLDILTTTTSFRELQVQPSGVDKIAIPF